MSDWLVNLVKRGFAAYDPVRDQFRVADVLISGQLVREDPDALALIWERPTDDRPATDDEF